MLVGVVGQSGVGKDTLLAGARAALAGDDRFRWARRGITRPAMPGAEDHLPLDEAQFTALAEAGGFALHWAANGLRYGIFRGIEAELAAGHVVVANLSRLVLVDAARRYPLRVLDVTAPPAVLAQRIAGRGREDAAATAARLARTVPIPPGLDVETIVNDGPPETGIAAMLAALNRAAADARRPGRAPPAPLG